MRLADFHYDLPDELIAREPTPERRGSRLLLVPASGEYRQAGFPAVLDWLRPGDVLVRNNTRVLPARLFGRKASGGKLEILIERLESHGQVLAHVRASRSPLPGSRLEILDMAGVSVVCVVDMLERVDDLFRLRFPAERPLLDWLEQTGHMPLPPYIDRADALADRERYQTVYAQTPGAVAAPTAGLHFDDALFATLQQRGIDVVDVTLHVGAGTFRPVRSQCIEDHQMHSEWCELSAQAAERINAARAAGGRVVAVGTTSVRTLESAAAARPGDVRPWEPLQAFSGDTRIFITPGYEFSVVDAMVTNFHLPESTLLMLVSAFAGWSRMREAYALAVRERYRFFSYGDAMLIEKNPQAGSDLPPSVYEQQAYEQPIAAAEGEKPEGEKQ